VDAGLDSHKIEVHYQGIDTDYFTPATPGDSINVPENDPMILFVGGLSERKGIRDLLQASVATQSRSPHRLVIAGEGELEDEVRSLAGSSRHINLVGALDRAGIRSLMRSARALVVPSRAHNGWREAAGLVALEAAACGTPVIASDCGGLSEMVVDGQTGVLVREGEPAELAEAIRQMVSLPPAEYSALSSAARVFAVKERSLHKSCAELATHYDEVV
jgi:glycosyltransferase involved in cell wall biosynthesis